ncbi:MAG: MTAP family purine nucleoside phosphorylase [Candidatus Thermoplasmatota archaeon]
MRRIGIITGTGLSGLAANAEPVLVETPSGEIEVSAFLHEGAQIFFLPRHGTAHHPAHVVDHKANVEALARCKVERVIALNTVGALTDTLTPGMLVVPHDYLDMRSRHASFYDDSPVHVDMSEPYCGVVRRALVDAAHAEGAPIVPDGVYAATEGPRLETPAEVRALRMLGGTIVGMTGCPEAALARERRLCYASLCLVTNPASGVANAPVSAETIRAGARSLAPLAVRVALRAAAAMPAARDTCGCARSLEGASL